MSGATNMLLQLTAQAEGRGSDLITLRALIEEPHLPGNDLLARYAH